MASTQFLTNTKLLECRPVRFAGEVVPGENTFRRLKEAGAGKRHSPARLLAEPALGSETDGRFRDATWFSPFPGDGQPLTGLQGADRANAEAALREHLQELAPMLADPETGPLLGGALLVPSLDDVYVVDGRPVIANWGFVPDDVDDTDEALDAHFQETLGQYADYARPWAMAGSTSNQAEESAGSADTGNTNAAGALAVAASGGGGDDGNPPPDVIVAEDNNRPWYWTWGFIAFYISLLLAAGVLLGWFLHPTAKVVGLPDGVDQRAAQQGINDALRAEIGRIDVLLRGDVCGVEAADYLNPVIRPTIPRQSPGIADTESPDPPGIAQDGDPDDPADEAGESPEQKSDEQPTDGGEAKTASGGRATIRELLEGSAVLVLATKRTPDGGLTGGTGTGFFIAPDTIVTNSHVVLGSDGKGFEDFRVTSQSLGRVLPAELLVSSPCCEPGQRDYAVLKILEPVGTSLSLASRVEKLTPVFIGGYPGFITERDPDYERLLKGDLTATPEMAMGQGDVILVQTPGGQVPQVIHTAMTARGNSGGPVVDICSRLVGIHTRAVDSGGGIAETAKVALASADLADYLSEQQMSFELSEDDCPQ